MALSEAQKNKILQILGYPGRTIDATSVMYEKVLADRFLSLPTDTEALVTSLLTSITALETKIAAAPARFMAEQVGDIKLNTDEMAKLRKERRTVAREIGQLLDIPMRGGGGVSVVC